MDRRIEEVTLRQDAQAIPRGADRDSRLPSLDLRAGDWGGDRHRDCLNLSVPERSTEEEKRAQDGLKTERERSKSAVDPIEHANTSLQADLVTRSPEKAPLLSLTCHRVGWFLAAALLAPGWVRHPAEQPSEPLRVGVTYNIASLDPHVDTTFESLEQVCNIYEPLGALPGG
jgi:hypothetical protein